MKLNFSKIWKITQYVKDILRFQDKLHAIIMLKMQQKLLLSVEENLIFKIFFFKSKHLK